MPPFKGAEHEFIREQSPRESICRRARLQLPQVRARRFLVSLNCALLALITFRVYRLCGDVDDAECRPETDEQHRSSVEENGISGKGT